MLVCFYFEALISPWSSALKAGSDTHVEMQLWQVFAGAKERWVEGEYQELLGREAKVVKPTLEKWASQIEKVMGYDHYVKE